MTKTVEVTIKADVEEKKTLMLRQNVGTAEDPEGNQYELSLVNMTMPCVRSGKTGKWFIIRWQNIIDAAKAAGIDE